MANTPRTALPNVVSIDHKDIGFIEVGPDQQFYKTPKTYELWQETPLRRLAFWRSTSIFWVIEKDETDA